jgi:large subunit ribosomal protein L33
MERERSRGRIRIALTCSRCGSRNYRSTKARSAGGKVLKLKKFCKTCNEHTEHVEAA